MAAKPKSEDLYEAMFKRFGVPVNRGVQVKYDGRPATIVGIKAEDRLKLKFTWPQDTPLNKFEYHPVIHMDYGNGIDYEAACSDGVEKWREEQGLPT